jgi:hypothetical protein
VRKIVKKGLIVGYSVSEQVAGHFNVLISRSVAKKLHISGSTATGLPSGTEPQVVIATAVIVTTKGGHSTLSIHLPKKIAKRLGKAKKLAVLLQLTVRNAASSEPTSTTVLTAAKLTA